MSFPILTLWRLPSSAYSIGTVPTPIISPISGPRAAGGPPFSPEKTAPRAPGLLLVRGRVHDDARKGKAAPGQLAVFSEPGEPSYSPI
jgi:hypothetical protein